MIKCWLVLRLLFLFLPPVGCKKHQDSFQSHIALKILKLYCYTVAFFITFLYPTLHFRGSQSICLRDEGQSENELPWRQSVTAGIYGSLQQLEAVRNHQEGDRVRNDLSERGGHGAADLHVTPHKNQEST